jgi:hypothetical protein
MPVADRASKKQINLLGRLHRRITGQKATKDLWRKWHNLSQIEADKRIDAALLMAKKFSAWDAGWRRRR